MSNTTPSADQFLMGGGIKSAKFETVGTTVGGPIAEKPEVQQQRDFSSGEPKFWNDGKPMLQLRVLLRTSQRDPDDPEDDGLRAIYVKGLLQKVVQQAVRAAGTNGLEVDGVLTVTYTGDGERKGNLNPPKLYSATYTSPDPLSQAAEPSPAPSAPPPAAGAAIPEGIDPAVWAALTPDQQAAVRAARQQAGQPTF